MGPGPPWSPRAPPKSVQRTVCAPSCPAPVGVTAGGLAWVRTSGGVGLCDLRPGAPMPGRVLLTRARFAGGGGGQGAPVLSWRPGLLALTPAGVAWASSLSPPPPPPACAGLALPGAPGGRLRSCTGGRGCPMCPRAQQCRNPRPTAAHVAHCLCLCVAQTQRRGSRGCCSGHVALAQRCGGEKSAALAFGTGPSSGSTTWYCGPLRAPCGMMGPA